MKIRTSPWGVVDHQCEHAPGIDFVSTPSHGGYHLSEERQRGLLDVFGFWQGDPEWLEEDCDAVLVYLAWPDLATDEQCAAAVESVRITAGWESCAAKWKPVLDWLDGDHPNAKLVVQKAKQSPFILLSRIK